MIGRNGKNRALAALCAAIVLLTATLAGGALAAGQIGEAEAKAIALRHAGLTERQVEFIRAYQDRDDGRVVYDVEFYSGDTKYDYEIDAASGRILEYDKDVMRGSLPAPRAGAYIGEARAKAIALADAKLSESQVRRMRVKLDREDGVMIYEVEFRREWTEYEYEIDAADGKILSSNVERHD